jgi:glycosyltransferase involved in cell wall biosynthesis
MTCIIIPAYNEGTHLIKTLKKIPSFVKQIIVVDDGSSDNTYQLAKQYARQDNRILLLQNKSNTGKGFSMRKGVKHAKHQKLIFIDASQFNPQDILKFKDIKKGEMYIGLRDFLKIPWYRKITNSLSNFAIYTSTGEKVKDSLSGFRAIHKTDFEKLNLKENRYSIESEMVYKSLKKRLHLYFIPIRINYSNVPSSIMNFKHNWQIIKFLIKANLGMIK